MQRNFCGRRWFLPKSSTPYRSRADFPQEMFTASGAEDFDRVSTFTASGAESFDMVSTFAADGAEYFDRVTMFAADGAEEIVRVTTFIANGAEYFDRVFLAPSEKNSDGMRQRRRIPSFVVL